LEVIYCRPECALSPTCFFSNPQWNFMCYYTKVYLKNGRWQEIDLKIIFWLQVSYSPHSGTNTKIKWDMCLCILNIILKYAVGTCYFGGDLLPTWLCIESDVCFFSNPQWNFMCYYTKVYFNIIPTIHKKSKTTTITNFILDEIKRSISISVYYGWKRQ
jgi:hypothetical protein